MSTRCCPVCRASTGPSVECPRCGADLEPLFALEARAFLLRQEARGALRSGDLPRAILLAHRAQRTCAHPAGDVLYRVARLCHRLFSRRPRTRPGRLAERLRTRPTAVPWSRLRRPLPAHSASPLVTNSVVSDHQEGEMDPFTRLEPACGPGLFG
ncbi:MAG: hypothetical protein HY319_00315 [Armatimonadetes bacterium]|nr:hypothetical protein [Armatimonadota bacterium]